MKRRARVVSSAILGIACAAAGATRAVPLNVPSAGKIGFQSLSPSQTGITFTNILAPERHLTNQIFLNGSGVTAGDIDRDGLTDLYFCALNGGNKLFRNLGNWNFQEIAGPPLPPLAATGAALADLDGDADLDLVVNSVGDGAHLLINDGKGQFTGRQILNEGRAGMSLAFADVEGDGDLDFYVANYRTVTIRDQPNTAFNFKTINGKPTVVSINGRPLTEPDLTNRFDFRVSGTRFSYEENGEPDALYLNDGKGHFTPARPNAFLADDGKHLDWGLSVMFRDLNQDGAPDIYVCNDFKSPDRIWMNNGKGQFRPAAPISFRQISLSSMGVDVADINRDGYDDIFVVDMLSRDHSRRHQQRIDIRAEPHLAGAIENRPQTSRNTLFLNRGDGTYSEIAQLSGLDATEWSWTPAFLDVDLDGFEDLLITTGFERDNMNVDVLRRMEAAKKEQKLSTLEQLHLRQMFPRLNTQNFAFRNSGNLKFTDASQEWGFDATTISQGMALADLDNDGDLDVVVNNMNAPAGVYRNESPKPRVAVRLKGKHATGGRISISGGPAAQSQTIIIGGRYLSSDDPMRTFACGDSTDLQIEVAWRNGTRTVITNAKPNHFFEIEAAGDQAVAATDKETLPTPQFDDASALLAHTHQQEPVDDLALQPLLPFKPSQAGPGIAWTETGLCIGGTRPACYKNTLGAFSRGTDFAAPTRPIAKSPSAIFVAGQLLPQRFPEAAASTINGKAVADLGHVSGAVFSDLDSDGDADLVVACNPGTIKVLENKAGEFTDQTKRWGLDQYSGFWNGVTVGDFNGDGGMDLAASNLGRNSRYNSFAEKELTIFYADFDDNGSVEWLETYRAGGRLLPIQPFHTVGMAMPWVREKVQTFAAYAHASMDEIHGEKLQAAKGIPLNWLETTVFLNRGTRFEPKTLPIEAQFAPAFGICVADFDGDGNEDLFLAQNLFAVPADVSRYDGGRGLWLRGKGDGTFDPVPGQESGIAIYGEQRGAAVCDYDGDGRTDIAVTQNGAQTKLYRNVKAKPGLRVRVQNPIGTILRLRNGTRLGPAREIHAGAGYWSQDSAVPVLHGDWATHVEVRWPGGKTSAHDIPKGAKELQITN